MVLKHEVQHNTSCNNTLNVHWSAQQAYNRSWNVQYKIHLDANNTVIHMTVCGLSLHQGNTESRKTLEQKFIFQIGTLNPDGINERFSFN